MNKLEQLLFSSLLKSPEAERGSGDFSLYYYIESFFFYLRPAPLLPPLTDPRELELLDDELELLMDERLELLLDELLEELLLYVERDELLLELEEEEGRVEREDGVE